MFSVPAVPSWNALHPLIIHFPVALLLISPIFILIGAALRPDKSRPYLIAAMILLLVGTAGIFVAVETGEAAAELAQRVPRIEQVLETHESLAHKARVAFLVVSIVFAGVVAGPKMLKKEDTRLTTTILPIAFVLLYLPACFLLINTAHNGGRLVHEFGIRATGFSSFVDAKNVGPSGDAVQVITGEKED